jgi:hypothetical protein
MRSNAANEWDGEENEIDAPEATEEVQAVPRLDVDISQSSPSINDERLTCHETYPMSQNLKSLLRVWRRIRTKKYLSIISRPPLNY